MKLTMRPGAPAPLGKRTAVVMLSVAVLGAGWLVRVHAQNAPVNPATSRTFDDRVRIKAVEAFEAGRHTFRHDTFGDEEFWGDKLQLHRAIEGEGLGGVGAGISPKAALGLRLKVDVDALPGVVIAALRNK